MPWYTKISLLKGNARERKKANLAEKKQEKSGNDRGGYDVLRDSDS